MTAGTISVFVVCIGIYNARAAYYAKSGVWYSLFTLLFCSTGSLHSGCLDRNAEYGTPTAHLARDSLGFMNLNRSTNPGITRQNRPNRKFQKVTIMLHLNHTDGFYEFPGKTNIRILYGNLKQFFVFFVIIGAIVAFQNLFRPIYKRNLYHTYPQIRNVFATYSTSIPPKPMIDARSRSFRQRKPLQKCRMISAKMMFNMVVAVFRTYMAITPDCICMGHF